MKFELRGERTDFPPEIVKGKTREAFISQWSKSVWQKAPVTEREIVLGEVWDILTPKPKQHVEVTEEEEALGHEIAAGLSEMLDSKIVYTGRAKKGKKNGIQADTEAPKDARPEEGNGGDSQQQADSSNGAE